MMKILSPSVDIIELGYIIYSNPMINFKNKSNLDKLKNISMDIKHDCYQITFNGIGKKWVFKDKDTALDNYRYVKNKISVYYQHRFSAENIISVICNYYKISYVDLIKTGRANRLPEKRFMCYYFLHKILNIGSTEIAKIFKNSHCVVLYGIKEIEKLVEVDKDVKIDFDNLSDELGL